MVAKINNASETKSRSLTPSILFWADCAKPSSAAVTFGLSGSDDPARAPEPSGLTDERVNQSLIRLRSR